MNELQIVQSRGEIVAQQTVGAELFESPLTMTAKNGLRKNWRK